jgi:hypothetical protein
METKTKVPEITLEGVKIMDLNATSTPSGSNGKKKDLQDSPPKLKGPSGLLSSLNSPVSLDNYETTIEEWKNRGGKIAFIYDYVTDKYKKRIDKAALVAFIFGALLTMLSLGNFGINEETYPELAIGVKVASTVISVIVTISAGIGKILGWPSLVTNTQKYLDTVENFVALIISEQTLPVKFRINRDQFILDQKNNYQTILQNAPDIPHDDYVRAVEIYAESTKSRFRSDLVNI